MMNIDTDEFRVGKVVGQVDQPDAGSAAQVENSRSFCQGPGRLSSQTVVRAEKEMVALCAFASDDLQHLVHDIHAVLLHVVMG
jgi:hypothetical protein